MKKGKNNPANWWILGVVAIIAFGIMYVAANKVPKYEEDDYWKVNWDKAKDVKEASDNTVSFGAVLPITGDAAAYGLAEQKGAMLAVEEINANGGINGKKINLAIEDGKCDGKEAATAAQKLISITKVPAIIGGACSGETLGFVDIANENKVVIISPSATSPDITTKGGAYTFRFSPSDALASKVAAQYAMEDLGAKKAAIITENTDYAQGLRTSFSEAFQALGGSIEVDESFNTGTTDFRTQALKIKTANVDVVYLLPQTPAPGITIVKSLKDQGVTAPLLTAEVMIGREVAKDNAETLQSLIGFEAFFDENEGSSAAFTAAFGKKYNEEMAFPFYSANAYSAVYLLKELYEGGDTTGEMMQTKMANLSDWSGGALSGVTFDENGDIKWKSYSVMKVDNGRVNRDKVMVVD
jgi:branched-chain amino acid transport system substrate-binding protein